jgi:GNAT superfamily N-acetyltransferase
MGQFLMTGRTMKHETIDKIALVETAEVEAWRSVWTAAPEAARHALGLSCDAGPDGALALRATRFGWWFFNRVLGLGLDGIPDRGWLAAQFDRYGAAGQPFGVSLCEARAPDLAPWLTTRGLRPTTTLAKMMRGSGALPPQKGDLRFREVGIEDAGLFASVTQRGFGMPPTLDGLFAALTGARGWRCYLAFAAGEPVATGAVHLQGGTAWIGFGSVLPEHRHRGVHGQMLLHRMHRAADLGCRWLVTETNLPDPGEVGASFRNMRRLGFETVCERRNFLSAP